MSGPAKRQRTRRSYAIELACEASVWVMNLWQIARGLRSMDLLAATTAGMIFLFAPVGMWRAIEGLRRRDA